MSRLREMRERSSYKAKEIAERIGISAPLYSVIETDKALPYPIAAKKLCRVLGVEMRDLYDRSEIRFEYGRDYRSGNADIANLSARVPKEIKEEYLSAEILAALGYESYKAWVMDMARKTKERYERLLNGEREYEKRCF